MPRDCVEQEGTVPTSAIYSAGMVGLLLCTNETELSEGRTSVKGGIDTIINGCLRKATKIPAGRIKSLRSIWEERCG